MPTYECNDFRGSFTRVDWGRPGADPYPVEAEDRATHTVTSTFQLPMSSMRLDELVVDLAHSGLRQIAPADQALALLGDQTSLRLVALNSCNRARTTLTDPFGGIATSLAGDSGAVPRAFDWFTSACRSVEES